MRMRAAAPCRVQYSDWLRGSIVIPLLLSLSPVVNAMIVQGCNYMMETARAVNPRLTVNNDSTAIRPRSTTIRRPASRPACSAAV